MIARFGSFELDFRSSDLRRDGVRRKLGPQPLQVLTLLALRPDEVVTREQIRRELWDGGTNVDWQAGINFCIRQIRRALDEGRTRTRFLETVPRRGYRFRGPVEVLTREPSLVGPAAPRARPSGNHPVGAGYRAFHRLPVAPWVPYRTTSDAYRAYLTGRYLWNKRTEIAFASALKYFLQAIDDDPTFALAYASLADCYLILSRGGPLAPREAYCRARAAAMKALELDSRLAEAHAALGHVEMRSGWNWNAAEQEFRTATELDPFCPTAYQWYADYLAAMGRPEDALCAMMKAWELDPVSMVISADVGWSFYFAHRYSEAIEQYERTLELEPDFLPARSGLGLVYLEQSRFDEAIAELIRSLELSPDDPMIVAALAYAYARAGHKALAQETLAALRKLSKRAYVAPYDFGIVYLALGERDRGFGWLYRAFEERSVNLIFLRSDPRFAAEQDPRLRALGCRIGLN